MTMLRLFATSLLLVVALVHPLPVASADEGSAASTPGATPSASPGVPLRQLAAMVPATLDGYPLTDRLRLATGPEALSMMAPTEAGIVHGLIDEAGRTVGDYTAASSFVTVDEGIVVVQAHRIEGIDAVATLESWTVLLANALDDPRVEAASVAGRPAMLLRDLGHPEVPPLYVFSAGDVIWMVLAADEAIVAEAMRAVGADGPEDVTASE